MSRRYPHVPVACTAGGEDVNRAGLRAALADIEQPVSQGLVVDRPHMVEQWHGGVQLIWDPITEVVLTGVAAEG